MHKLDILSTQIFSEIRLQFEERWNSYTRELHIKFLAILWVAQEILKSLIYNPPWDRIADRPQIRELRWDDQKTLLMETSQNTRSLLAQIPLSTRRERGQSRQPKRRRESIPQPPPSYTQEHIPPHDAVNGTSTKPKLARTLVNTVRKLLRIKK